MRTIQNSFNGGEWSSLMEGRTDLEKYRNAVKKLENFVIDPRGPIMYRPGLRYIAGTKTNSVTSRVIPFIFSTTTAYIIEFGNLYVRFFKDQAQVESGGSPVEVVTPYATADLGEIKYCQSADVLYLFHPDYAPRKLSRSSDTVWLLTIINFRPGAMYEEAIEPSPTLTLSALTGSDVTLTVSSPFWARVGDVGRIVASGTGRAVITSWASANVAVCDIIDDFASTGPIASGSWELQGSPLGTVQPTSISPVGAVTILNSPEITEDLEDLLEDPNDHWTVSGSAPSEYYLKNSAPFYSTLKPYKMFELGVELPEATMGSLSGSEWDWGDNDTLGYSTIYIRLSDSTDPDTKASANESYIQKSWGLFASSLFRSTDVGKYVRLHNGLLKITTYTSAISVTCEILKELSAKTATTNFTIESDMWTAANGYPSCGNFFEDRLFMAGSPVFPETVWGSVTGDYENHTPGVEDSDAIQFSLAGRQVSIIQWIEPRDYLIVGCLGGEWRVGPDDTGTVLTPLNITAREKGTNGCANIMPITVDSSTIFIQRLQKKLREFTYDWEADGYKAPDLSILAEHITENNLAGMAFQQNPLPTLWFYRDDGKLIGMTYMRDHDVVGWHLHESGSVESVAVIPGANHDELWMIVSRFINSGTVRNIEMMENIFSDTSATFKANKGLNAFFVDSGKTYNGAATTTITGAGHLEGETVSVLADGSYVSGKVVSGGEIALDIAASVVHYGLPYTGTMQTMRFDAMLQDGTAQSKKKRISRMNVRVHESGPFKQGRDEDNLKPVSTTTMGAVVFGEISDLYTGDLEVGHDGQWEKEGRLVIVQDNPLPLTLLAIMPEVKVS